MFIMLQCFLFCLLMSCSKPSASPVMNGNDSTLNNNGSTGNTPEDSVTNTDAVTYTWLALGDSYTIGQSVNEAERFPAQTISILKNEKPLL